MLPKTSVYAKSYDGETKCMYVSIENDELLVKYNIWEKLSIIIKKESDSVDKTSQSKECYICHSWCFLDKGFKFPQYLYNGCYNVLMMSLYLSNFAILNINGVDYCCIINEISKIEAVNLLQKAYLIKKK